MPVSEVPVWQCEHCQHEAEHPNKELHRRMNLFFSRLDEQQKRWYAAIESDRIGWGGDTWLSRITGISRKTIRRGRKELDESLAGRNVGRVRSPGGGRRLIEVKEPTILSTLEQMLDADNEIAGDPMNEQKWVRSTLKHLCEKLEEQGFQVSPTPVRRLLKKMDFSLKGNKKTEFGSKHPNRNDQFEYIASQRQEFTVAGLPIISVDTKKKELIGGFRKNGEVWCKVAEEVSEHDFPSLAVCRAVPYGIYDVTKNKGYVFVGTAADTPEFAVDAIAKWWELDGQVEYPAKTGLLILADGGGCNEWRSRAWKKNVQDKLCDQRGLTVAVCHYPPGCSKWNPIEHRLFSYISINWAGKPLRTLETMLGYIRGTTTKTGLSVKARLQEGSYNRGQRVTGDEMAGLFMESHTVCADWNYTIYPR
ncbi:MAG: ISAzo13 family transposase [Blastocatellia bacterium]